MGRRGHRDGWRAAVLFAALLMACLAMACGPTPTGRDASPIDVGEDPVQANLDASAPLGVRRGGTDYRLIPKAHYVLRGVVVGRTSYHFDAKHALAPCDVAMCWGALVGGRQYAQLKWSQSTRWYWWRYG